jgi:predicted dehydrogenase
MPRTSYSSASRVWLTFFIVLLHGCNAFFGQKRRREERERKEREEAERLAKLVILFGKEIPKTTFYVLTSIVALLIALILIYPFEQGSKKRGNRPDSDDTVDVIVIGCGLPKKGLGWFHITQLLTMERVNILAVVEPFYMSSELCPSPPDSWKELMASLSDIGVRVVPSMADLPPLKKRSSLCLISAQTNDNLKYFKECVLHLGAKFVFLEEPGAPTVGDLSEMQQFAERSEVRVFVGYNKNLMSYVQKSVSLARQVKNASVLFCHNNSYTQSDLPEVFTRNPEGMMRSMAIHELALLVTYFDVTVENIEKLKVNSSKLFSEKLSVWKPGTSLPNPEYITDFSRCAFKISLKNGRHMSVMTDRCGGNVSFSVVKDEAGKEVERFEFPTPAEQEQLELLVASDPTIMPQFLVHQKDYFLLKDRVINSILDGTDADGVATLKVAIETLKLADYANNILNKSLRAK